MGSIASDSTQRRLPVVRMCILLCAASIVGRLFFLQITHAEYYRAQAERQHAIALLTTPRRGDIYFMDKTGRLVPAASTRRVYALSGNPHMIGDVDRTYTALAEVLPIQRDDFFRLARDTEHSFVSFQKDIEKDTADRIAALELPGIWLVEEEARGYPAGPLASQTLGFVGFDGDDRVGRYGIEQQYEDALQGKEGSVVGERSAFGSLLTIGRTLFYPKQDGFDVVLTIDPNIQSFAASVLRDTARAWHARSAGVLIMDPKTGAILAMEALPSFDPNTYNTAEDYNIFLNPFTQSLFEVGSIFKPLTMAAGLDAHAVSETTTYTDTGSVHVEGAVIRNYDGKARGVQNMTNILEQSLNTGSVFIMRQLGIGAFRTYIENFGLGDATGIDLPNEVAGNLQNLHSGREVESATASFGQGISVTPVSLAAALSSIANGGELMRPYVVSRIMRNSTVVQETVPDVRRRVLKTETTQTVSRMLTQVVDTVLAGGAVKIPGYSIAAKTGTAQIANKNSAGYSEEFLHTFFGYGPSFDPRFLILLYLERPQGVRYASQTLSTPFYDLTQFLINYYEIPPDRAEVEENPLL